jgi:hypothetical protein
MNYTRGQLRSMIKTNKYSPIYLALQYPNMTKVKAIKPNIKLCKVLSQHNVCNIKGQSTELQILQHTTKHFFFK